jgi:predicted DNA binding CopG/RHH family protein
MKTKRKIRPQEIVDYDKSDTASFVKANKPLRLGDIGVSLPSTLPTQVVSIRLPTPLLNELRALGSEQDVPYQALIKLFLADAVAKRRKSDSSHRR